jgi:hypothetical protein
MNTLVDTATNFQPHYKTSENAWKRSTLGSSVLNAVQKERSAMDTETLKTVKTFSVGYVVIAVLDSAIKSLNQKFLIPEDQKIGPTNYALY